jgi:hypothetical protein
MQAAVSLKFSTDTKRQPIYVRMQQRGWHACPQMELGSVDAAFIASLETT